jgi:hypothetical protein
MGVAGFLILCSSLDPWRIEKTAGVRAKDGAAVDSRDAVLESDMVDLGVAAKQKSRARQGFRRSAEQAKLGKDRLVMPGGVSLDSKPNGGASRKMDQPNATQIAAGELNPMLLSLIEELPATGEWSRDERDLWARLFLRMVDKTYKVKE